MTVHAKSQLLQLAKLYHLRQDSVALGNYNEVSEEYKSLLDNLSNEELIKYLFSAFAPHSSFGHEHKKRVIFRTILLRDGDDYYLMRLKANSDLKLEVLWCDKYNLFGGKNA